MTLGGSQGRPGWVRKTSPLPGLDPRITKSVASRYNDYAIPAIQRFIPKLFAMLRASSVTKQLLKTPELF
jgi:hypothetical protein